MTKLIREILVLPLKLLLLVTRFFPVVDRYALIKWIWKVGRTNEAGFELVMMTVDKFGLEAGRTLAHEILKETRSALIVYGIGLQEWLDKNYDAAKEWIDLGEEMGCEDSYYFLSLKLNLSHLIAEYNHGEIVEEMLACNYLPMEYTHQALLNKAYILFKEKQYHKAEEIIDHMIKVRNDQAAEYLKAELCLMRNEDTLAEKLLAKSRKHMSEVDYNINVALAYYAADRVDESMEWVYKAVNGGYNKEEGHPGIKYIIESDKFAEYCAMRN
jgi:tetratricopeptide (TPR) repeat protein